MSNPMAYINMANGAKIVIELMPEAAPNTVNSFIHLAQLGVFDGHTIQRIVPGYVADVSFSAFGRQEAKYLIDNESRAHGFSNDLRVEPGVIAMGGYGGGIAGGEFFFPYGYHANIDGHYPAFGVVKEGWAEIERWATVELAEIEYPGDSSVRANAPLEPIVIESVTVDTFGQVFPPPVLSAEQNLPPNWR